MSNQQIVEAEEKVSKALGRLMGLDLPREQDQRLSRELHALSRELARARSLPHDQRALIEETMQQVNYMEGEIRRVSSIVYRYSTPQEYAG